MNLLLLKLILTPILIGLASLAGLRWGHAVSGWLVALPLTAGPIVFFLSLSHGAAFGADAAAGTLTGGFSLAVFVVVYGRLAISWRWLPTLTASSLAFLLMTAVLREVHLPLIILWLAVTLVFLLALRLLPSPARKDSTAPVGPMARDIPLRMVVATAFVFVITSLASRVGPHLAGLLAPFPLFTATLAAFAQREQGPVAAISVLRGLLTGLFAYAAFMFTVAALLIPAGIAIAFAAGAASMTIFQTLALGVLRRQID